MGVEQWEFKVSTPSLALPLQGGGDGKREFLNYICTDQEQQ